MTEFLGYYYGKQISSDSSKEDLVELIKFLVEENQRLRDKESPEAEIKRKFNLTS